MSVSRDRELLGIFLVVLGVLFLLANNDILWFGWDALWPAFPLIIGLFSLRVYVVRRKPRQLYWGTFFALLGVFFFMFSTGIKDWSAMGSLWPTFPLIVGISLLAITGVVERGTSSLVVGVAFVIFAVVGYVAESGALGNRMSQPLARLWPLVLIAAGVLVILRTRQSRRPQAVEPEEPATASPQHQSSPAEADAPRQSE